MRHYRWLAVALALSVVAYAQQISFGQEPKAAQETKNEDDRSAGKKKAPSSDLARALKAVPGCLGVETARTSGGKNVIFAWFENKQAVMKWYYSDVHQDLMHQWFPDADYKKPLKDVPKDSGPLLVIASITPAKESKFKATTMPISQIAIEFYQPVPGGTFLGGRFTPAGVKVPNMRDYTSGDKQP